MPLTGSIKGPYPDAAYPPEFDAAHPRPLTGRLLGDPTDAAMDAAGQRPGRSAAGWNDKGWDKVTSPDMAKFLAEVCSRLTGLHRASGDRC